MDDFKKHLFAPVKPQPYGGVLVLLFGLMIIVLYLDNSPVTKYLPYSAEFKQYLIEQNNKTHRANPLNKSQGANAQSSIELNEMAVFPQKTLVKADSTVLGK